MRSKSKSFEDYKKAMYLKANTSNTTVYKHKEENIAYWHGNFILIRDKKLHWSKIMDGTNATKQWKGLHVVLATVYSYDPENGWLQNCNSTPYAVAGVNNPKEENYPPYMAPDGESFRGLNAVRLLSKSDNYSLDKLITNSYDSKLSAFEYLLPALITNFEENIKTDNSSYAELIAPICILKNWDYYARVNSIATTLAVEWAFQLNPVIQKV